MLYYERTLKKQGYPIIIGVDEAGRGPLAGPVVAAAARLKSVDFKSRIDDSKKLSPLQRQKAYDEIVEKSDFGIAVVSHEIIDEINILEATRRAMHQAISFLLGKLTPYNPAHICVIIDGTMGLDIPFRHTDIIGGDARSMSIASASILAKVIRDRIMREYDAVFPGYGFGRHKGYPTHAHRLALKEKGLTSIHRRSFSCV